MIKGGREQGFPAFCACRQHSSPGRRRREKPWGGQSHGIRGKAGEQRAHGVRVARSQAVWFFGHHKNVSASIMAPLRLKSGVKYCWHS